jgi:hypothetical protein
MQLENNAIAVQVPQWANIVAYVKWVARVLHEPRIHKPRFETLASKRRLSHSVRCLACLLNCRPANSCNKSA